MNAQESWQAEVNGQIYDASFEELAQWIYEGAILPQDKVRRGNLRWLEAGKVPLLLEFFNAKENGIAPPVLTTTNVQTNQELTSIISENYLPENISEVKNRNLESEKELPSQTKKQTAGFCAIHNDLEEIFICESCLNGFCRGCPKSFGSVKICPFCGSMCKYAKDSDQTTPKNFSIQPVENKKFGFSDFGNALVFPFKFKTSLILGALMFMFFTLCQSAGSFGGLMFAGAVFSAMLANALVFGVLANTIDNFSTGKIDKNFMPDFEDFSAWDDVIQPFFLSVGTYLVSFGLMIALIIGAAWFAIKSLSQIDSGKEKIVSKVLPNASSDLNSANQLPQMKQLTEKLKKDGKWQNGEMPDENTISQMQSGVSKEEADFRQLQDMIKQTRQSQLPPIDETENDSENFGQLARDVARTSLIFSIPVFLAFLWGIFYFPAACAVAGYTRSFTATLNPLVGLDTIRRLGFDYFKILAMCFLLAIFSFAVNIILGIVFAPLDLPQLGNLPAKAVASFFTFYFSIVFSLVLGFAIYRNSRRLNLFRS